MRPVFALYAVSALVLVAMTGPAFSSTRDAALADIEKVGEPQPLTDYPFLNAVHDHLPPLVVDWVITNRLEGLEIPEGAEIEIDSEGRFILVWDDGCREPYHDGQETRGPECDGDPDESCGADEVDAGGGCEPVCPADHTHVAGDGCRPPQLPDCPPGQVYAARGEPGGPGCVVDPACDEPTDGNNTTTERPAGCPEPAPTNPCSAGSYIAYDGACARTGGVILVDDAFTEQTAPEPYTFDVRLPTAPIDLQIQVDSDGNLRLQIELTDNDSGQQVCFDGDADIDDGDEASCTVVVEAATPAEFTRTQRAILESYPDGRVRTNMTLTVTVEPQVIGQPFGATVSLLLSGTAHPPPETSTTT